MPPKKKSRKKKKSSSKPWVIIDKEGRFYGRFRTKKDAQAFRRRESGMMQKISVPTRIVCTTKRVRKEKGTYPFSGWDGPMPGWKGISYPKIKGGKGPKKFTAGGFKGIKYKPPAYPKIKMDFKEKKKKK